MLAAAVEAIGLGLATADVIIRAVVTVHGFSVELTARASDGGPCLASSASAIIADAIGECLLDVTLDERHEHAYVQLLDDFATIWPLHTDGH